MDRNQNAQCMHIVPTGSGGAGGALPLGNVTIWPTTLPNSIPNGLPLTPTGQWQPQTFVTAAPPTYCAGDVHVFPCPHCAKCKCGRATVDRR